MDSREESMYTDPTTGANKATKLARFDLMPVEAIYQLAEHYGAGAEKYGDHNWEKGYPYGLSYAALNRHLWKWWGGEDVDEETGSHHLIAVVWHALALIEFSKTHPEMDDRPKDNT